jgi:crotonobetaine/carnitine-CoA ligase
MSVPQIPDTFKTAYDVLAATAAAHPRNIFLCVPTGTEEERKQRSQFTEIDYGTALGRIQELRGIFERSGIGHGHRVAVLLGNRPEYFYVLLALNALGAWVLPINPESSADEMLYQVSHAEVDMGIVGAVRKADLDAVFKRYDPALQVYAVENLPAQLSVRKRELNPGPPGRDTIASVLYTSGTTGKPKGCLISNEYFLTAGAWYLTREGHQTLPFGEGRIFNPFPVYHMNAGVVSLMAVAFSANCLVQWDRFHPKTWWRDIVATGATALHYMGLIPPVLVKADPVPEEKQHKVKYAFGAGVDPDIHVEFEKRFGIPLIEVFGMTELGRTISNSIDPREITTRAFGRARDGFEVMIADDDDKPLPKGTAGNLLVRLSGDNPRKGFFSGYLKEEAITEAAWRNGWFHTGDICREGDGGMLYFVDRKKNIIRRSGENIAAAEVEAAIAGHSSVHTVACLPVPDAMRDEEVMACIVLQPGIAADRAKAEEIFAHTFGQLTYFKTPGWIVFRDKLPTTTTSKIQKNQIFGPDEEPTGTPLSFDFRDRKKRQGNVSA